jgi:hypothetical protein
MIPFPMAKPTGMSLRKPFERAQFPKTEPFQSTGAQSPLDGKVHQCSLGASV